MEKKDDIFLLYKSLLNGLDQQYCFASSQDKAFMQVKDYMRALQIHEVLVSRVFQLLSNIPSFSGDLKYVMVNVSKSNNGPISDLDAVCIHFLSTSQLFEYFHGFIKVFNFYKCFLNHILNMRNASKIIPDDLQTFNAVIQKFFWTAKIIVELLNKAAYITGVSSNMRCLTC